MRRGAALCVLCCALAWLLPVGAQASGACNQMRHWLREGSGAAAGLIVVDAKSGQTMCSSAPSQPRSLASNTKLFTTSTALTRLGPNFQIPTKVFADGPIENGVLHGNLYLQGGGDPTLGTPGFYNSYFGGLGTNIFSLSPQIRAAGIETVTGRLYADDTIFDRLRGVADSGYATSSEIGPLSGLEFNAGFAGRTSSSGFASDPAKVAAAKLAQELSHSGVRISTSVALAKTPAGAKRVAIVESPMLNQIIDQTDVYSINFFAEMLIKLIGARLGSGGTTAAGAAVVASFAHSHGSGIHAVDGSGLTRSNRASPRQVADLLLAMRGEPDGEQFALDLALAGEEGTVEHRMGGTAAFGRCRVKTGTLSGVSNLSGYCFNASGREMVFSVLMNGVNDESLAHLDQDRIAGMVASY